MAEDIIEVLTGGGEETPEVEELESIVSADAFAAATTMQQAGYGPEVAKATEAFLGRQGALLEVQTRHMEAEHRFRLAHLRGRLIGLNIRNAFQVFIALAATVIGLGVLTMLVDAFTSRSVVVDAFKAPPAIASRGLSGDVVAKGVLDDLQKMQYATRATGDKGPLSARGAWASDIKVEVPETGVSIGEISRMLHERFGHDVHITGELIQNDAGGFALTVRGDGVPAATFTGGSSDLSKLTVQAAEYVYGRSQPHRYSVYLQNQNRYADAVAFLQGAFPREADGELRPRLANDWGNSLSGVNQPVRAAEKFRLAMSLGKPRSNVWWTAWDNLVGVRGLTDEETGWRDSHAFLKAAAAAPKREQPDLRLLSSPAQFTWDLPLLLASNIADSKLNGGAGATSAPDAPAIADNYAWMHDPADSAAWIAAGDPDDPVTKAEALLLQGYAALSRGDSAGAVAPLEAFYKAWATDPNLQYLYPNQPCFTGLAYGLAGRRTEAEGVFKRVGAQSLCFAFHGDVLVHAGDVAGAQRIWAEGLKTGPDLPPIPLHRGLWELGQGDLKAAEADVSAAAAKAPHWADPLKAWGDVLARGGRWRSALAKYDEAAKYAPAWAELKSARAEAARHGG
jgi:tetratricopeptide (TPR) repeat protein